MSPTDAKVTIDVTTKDKSLKEPDGANDDRGEKGTDSQASQSTIIADLWQRCCSPLTAFLGREINFYVSSCSS